MVQAAAQAQAVVAAAKSRGDGLVPMNQSQIAALSQIQAQAIVHARKSQGTPQQTRDQLVQLQAQALIHAHTTAQIAAGIYKGDEGGAAKDAAAKAAAPAPRPAAAGTEATPLAARKAVPNPVLAAAPTSSSASGRPAPASGAPSPATPMDTSEAAPGAVDSNGPGSQSPAPSSSSPQFLAQLSDSLDGFWRDQLLSVHELKEQTEADFKTHNDLPLARIKRIMKSDEDVRMISAEAPVLFAKACELFILDLSIRSWNYSQLHKRRTLQKEDIREAIQKTDIFDFLVDVI